MSMLKNIETYKEFLKKQNQERDTLLEIVSIKIVDGLTDYIKGWGWERKGKSGGLKDTMIKGVKYTKTFKGKEYIVEYRNNLRHDSNGLYYSTGFNEFVHDKSFGFVVPVMTHFKWNDDTCSSGWSLDEVLQRMEDFYSKL